MSGERVQTLMQRAGNPGDHPMGAEHYHPFEGSHVTGGDYYNRLEPFLGPPTKSIDYQPSDQFPHEAWFLPDAYKGRNDYIRETIVQMVVNYNSFITSEILPWRQQNNPNIAWDSIKFDKTLIDLEPEQGVPRYVTVERESHSDYMVRRGLALIVNHGFAATEGGRKDFAYKVATIAGAVQETCDQSGIMALLRSKNEYRHLVSSKIRNANDAFECFNHELWRFGIVQHSERGWYHLDAESQHCMRLENIEPDTWIVPSRMTSYAAMGQMAETEYYRAGADARLNLKLGEDNFTTFRGKKVFEVKPFTLDVDGRTIDPLNRTRMIGDFFIVPYYEKTVDANNKDKYEPEAGQTQVYCCETDRFETFTWKGVQRDVGLKDNNSSIQNNAKTVLSELMQCGSHHSRLGGMRHAGAKATPAVAAAAPKFDYDLHSKIAVVETADAEHKSFLDLISKSNFNDHFNNACALLHNADGTKSTALINAIQKIVSAENVSMQQVNTMLNEAGANFSEVNQFTTSISPILSLLESKVPHSNALKSTLIKEHVIPTLMSLTPMQNCVKHTISMKELHKLIQNTSSEDLCKIETCLSQRSHEPSLVEDVTLGDCYCLPSKYSQQSVTYAPSVLKQITSQFVSQNQHIIKDISDHARKTHELSHSAESVISNAVTESVADAIRTVIAINFNCDTQEVDRTLQQSDTINPTDLYATLFQNQQVKNHVLNLCNDNLYSACTAISGVYHSASQMQDLLQRHFSSAKTNSQSINARLKNLAIYNDTVTELSTATADNLLALISCSLQPFAHQFMTMRQRFDAAFLNTMRTYMPLMFSPQGESFSAFKSRIVQLHSNSNERTMLDKTRQQLTTIIKTSANESTMYSKMYDCMKQANEYILRASDSILEHERNKYCVLYTRRESLFGGDQHTALRNYAVNNKVYLHEDNDNGNELWYLRHPTEYFITSKQRHSNDGQTTCFHAGTARALVECGVLKIQHAEFVQSPDGLQSGLKILFRNQYRLDGDVYAQFKLPETAYAVGKSNDPKMFPFKRPWRNFDQSNTAAQQVWTAFKQNNKPCNTKQQIEYFLNGRSDNIPFVNPILQRMAYYCMEQLLSEPDIRGQFMQAWTNNNTVQNSWENQTCFDCFDKTVHYILGQQESAKRKKAVNNGCLNLLHLFALSNDSLQTTELQKQMIDVLNLHVLHDKFSKDEELVYAADYKRLFTVGRQDEADALQKKSDSTKLHTLIKSYDSGKEGLMGLQLIEKQYEDRIPYIEHFEHFAKTLDSYTRLFNVDDNYRDYTGIQMLLKNPFHFETYNVAYIVNGSCAQINNLFTKKLKMGHFLEMIVGLDMGSMSTRYKSTNDGHMAIEGGAKLDLVAVKAVAVDAYREMGTFQYLAVSTAAVLCKISIAWTHLAKTLILDKLIAYIAAEKLIWNMNNYVCPPGFSWQPTNCLSEVGREALYERIAEEGTEVHDNSERFDWLCLRPFREYTMGTALLMKRGNELGNTFRGWADFQLTDNIIAKTHIGHFTFWHASIVTNPKMLFMAEDVFCTNYIGGESKVVLPYSQVGDFQTDPLGTMSAAKASIIAVPVPIGSLNVDDHRLNLMNPVSLTGCLTPNCMPKNRVSVVVHPGDYAANGKASEEFSKALNQQGVQYGWTPTGEELAQCWNNVFQFGTMNRSIDYEMSNSFESAHSVINTYCFHTMQKFHHYKYDKWVVTNLNTGHFGENGVYEGVKKIRCGFLSYFKEMNYQQAMAMGGATL
jgi:hypothetical protein